MLSSVLRSSVEQRQQMAMISHYVLVLLRSALFVAVVVNSFGRVARPPFLEHWTLTEGLLRLIDRRVDCDRY